MKKPSEAEVIKQARDTWCSDALEIDDVPAVKTNPSLGEYGSWVAAWVWVPAETPKICTIAT